MSELVTQIVVELLRKSGVQEWTDTAFRQSIITAANEIAAGIEDSTMATSKILTPDMDGTPKQIVFADHAGDFSPAEDLRITTDGSNELDVQCTFASLGNNAARQTAKFDFGSVRASLYQPRCAFELAATPTAGNVIRLYLNFSQDATAGDANMAGCSGSDAAYTGYSSNLADSVKQLYWIGDFVCTAQATGTIQVGGVKPASFPALSRYASLVIYDQSGAAFHSDDVESHIVFDPVVSQGQAT